MTNRTARFIGPALLMVLGLYGTPDRILAQDSGKEATFQESAASAQKDLEQAKKDLAALREVIAEEKLPLTRRISSLETRLSSLRRDFEEITRQLDRNSLELANIEARNKASLNEKSYLSNLLDEYARNFESRVHITELQRYSGILEDNRRVTQGTGIDTTEVFRIQSNLVSTSLDRLGELLGGSSFEGTAIDSRGVVEEVRVALVGPVAYYSTPDGSSAGLAEQRLGSLEPNMIRLNHPEQTDSVRTLIASGSGLMPFDPSLGNALKIEGTQESWVEHAQKGGPVMVPILLLASAALIVALIKWFQLMQMRKPPLKRVELFLDAIKTKDYARAGGLLEKIQGPTGDMLKAGLDNITEQKELVEEMMFERMLETRLRLQSFLSFIALSAAAAPLLGLLGTVTGIINTFKLITVFGTGDPRTLSSGISEALITTEFGLIVAIPSLLLHAYLSRRSKSFVDSMEKTAVSFLNRLGGSPAPYREPQKTAGNGKDKTRIPGNLVPQPAMAGAQGSVTRGADH